MEKKFPGKDSPLGMQILGHLAKKHEDTRHHSPIVGEIREPVGDVAFSTGYSYCIGVPRGHFFNRRVDQQPVQATLSRNGDITVIASEEAMRHIEKSLKESNKKHTNR